MRLFTCGLLATDLTDPSEGDFLEAEGIRGGIGVRRLHLCYRVSLRWRKQGAGEG